MKILDFISKCYKPEYFSGVVENPDTHLVFGVKRQAAEVLRGRFLYIYSDRVSWDEWANILSCGPNRILAAALIDRHIALFRLADSTEEQA